MNTKIVFVLFTLILASTLAFAAPSSTVNFPSSNQLVTGTQTFITNYAFVDENAEDARAHPQKADIYWSTGSGNLSNLIYSDTNLQDASGLVCTDYNFFNSTDCNYSWVVPNSLTMPIGNYYIDTNFQYYKGASNSYAGTIGSSAQFRVQQPMPSTMTAMIALALFIAACAIAVFAVMGLSNGTDIKQFLTMVITIIVLLIIAWTLYGAVITV